MTQITTDKKPETRFFEIAVQVNKAKSGEEEYYCVLEDPAQIGSNPLKLSSGALSAIPSAIVLMVAAAVSAKYSLF